MLEFAEFLCENKLVQQVQNILHRSPERKKKGLLIVFEGPDGVGKSSQTELLVKWLRKQGHSVLQTKWNSDKIIKPATSKLKDKRILTPMLYSLMHAADQYVRYQEEIAPALEKGKIVVSDRYIYTSIARDKVRGVNVSILDKIYEGFRTPDILFHAYLPTSKLHIFADYKNLSYYGTGMDLGLSDDRKESYIKYEKLISKVYCQILPEVKTYQKLDMDRTIQEIAEDVRQRVRKVIGEKTFK